LVRCLLPSTLLIFFSFLYLKLGIYIKSDIDNNVYGILVVKWWNQNKNIWHVAIEIYYLFFILFFRNQLEKVDFLIKTLMKEFSLCWTSFYIYFYNYLNLYELEFIWTLFKILTIMYFILFYLNLWLNIYFLIIF